MKTTRTVVSALFVMASFCSMNQMNVYATSVKDDNHDELITKDCTYEGDVEAVDALIANIGDVTLNSKQDIDQARAAYDALTDEQRALCLNGYLLFEAEHAYQVLVNGTSKGMDELIQLDNRMGKVKDFTLANWQEINDINNVYQTLTLEEKAKLKNGPSFFMKYQDYLVRYKDEESVQELPYDAMIVDEFIAMIGNATENKDMYIAQARNAYNALSDDQKQLVEDYSVLLAAEQQLKQAKGETENKEKIEKNLKKEDVETSDMQELSWILGFMISGLALLSIKKLQKQN